MKFNYKGQSCNLDLFSLVADSEKKLRLSKLV